MAVQPITRSEIVNSLARLRRDWQDTAEGENLIDVKASIGFVLFDLSESFGLTKGQTKQVLGEPLFKEINECINSPVNVTGGNK